MDVSEPSSEVSLTAKICMAFKLTRSEAHMLALLLADGHATKEDLIARESALVGRTVTDNTVQTVICALRKKLTPCGIIITTIPRLGYGLDLEARHKIRSSLARYDAGFPLKRPSRPKPKAPDPIPDACAS